MRRNTTGLKKSARLRSEQAMERALAAVHRMDASDRDIDFRTAASEDLWPPGSIRHCRESSRKELSGIERIFLDQNHY
jgi:hypothetical protein